MSDLGELTAKAMALPAKDRAELAELLNQRLEEQDDETITSAWLAEISRRDQEIRARASVTTPADQVLSDAQEQPRRAR